MTFADLETRLSAISDRIEASAATAQVKGERVIAESMWLQAITLLVAAIIAAIAATLIVRGIMKSIDHLLMTITRITNGELGRDMGIVSRDELGGVLSSIKGMDDKFSEIVGSVHVTAETVRAAARQISQGNDDLSQRTQEQSAMLEQTAASMEEMAATVQQNADNARKANQLAVSACGQADLGGSVVQRTIGAMVEISSSSRRIAEIIGVIDEIAFQTNLLALNAAVEAARAGEQGRGFAVVASEVRTLAQRSAAAAHEIKGLIGESLEKVRMGTVLVDESGQTITQIMESVRKVTSIVAEIAAASAEQATSVEQVNLAVSQMDGTTQQNAALVEEAAAASKSMEHQTLQLMQRVSFFSTHTRHESIAASATTASTDGVTTLRTSITRPVAQSTVTAPGHRRARGDATGKVSVAARNSRN